MEPLATSRRQGRAAWIIPAALFVMITLSIGALSLVPATRRPLATPVSRLVLILIGERAAQNTVRLGLDHEALIRHGRQTTFLDTVSAYEQALQAYRQALALGGTSPELLSAFAEAYAALANHRQDQTLAWRAVVMARVALWLAPNRVETARAWADVLRRRGAYHRAAEAARRTLTLDPRDGVAHFILGESARRSGRQLEVARKELNLAARLEPQLVAAHAALGRVLMAQGKYREAAAAYRRGIASVPRALSLQLGLADALQPIGEFREAIGLYRGLAQDPEFAVAGAVGLAETYIGMGHHDRAIILLTDLLQKHPTHAGARLALARGYAGRGDHRRAIGFFTQAIVLSPSAPAYEGRGRAYLAVGRYREALGDFREILRLTGDRARFDALQAAVARARHEAWQAEGELGHAAVAQELTAGSVTASANLEKKDTVSRTAQARGLGETRVISAEETARNVGQLLAQGFSKGGITAGHLRAMAIVLAVRRREVEVSHPAKLRNDGIIDQDQYSHERETSSARKSAPGVPDRPSPRVTSQSRVAGA
ncbi:MAG: tetratricopeptide repeat protein, partial [Candidatus Methylomirabilales bacterium]